MENNDFIDISSADSLDHFLAKSAENPIVIFKHSNACGISSRAYSEVAMLSHPVGIVVVQEARSVSNEIEKRFGLPHETPQVLIVSHGQVVWAASHMQVKAKALENALRQVD